MKKNTMNRNIKQLKKLSSRMPRTINEAINFNEVDDMDMNMEDDFSSEKQLSAPKMDDNSEMGAEELLSDIRKKALKAMANLADTPEDPNYEVLKKIFMMLDKGVTEKQEQREVMAKNPNLNR